MQNQGEPLNSKRNSLSGNLRTSLPYMPGSCLQRDYHFQKRTKNIARGRVGPRAMVYPFLLAQASCRRINADSFAGNEKLNSPVLLPATGIIIRGYWQGAAETFGRNRTRRYALLHQIIAY